MGRLGSRSSPAVHRAGVPHLVATVRGETGVVGPLVVPGVTSCLRCADLHRRDADPRWPRLAAQLTAAEPPPSGATVTCLLTAATAALQVLAYLDGSGRAGDPGRDRGTAARRTCVPRLRRWPAHPACGCGAGCENTPTDELAGRTGRRGRLLPARPAPGREQWAADRAHELTRDDTAAPAGRAGAGEEDA